jgi:hypothetical protein
VSAIVPPQSGQATPRASLAPAKTSLKATESTSDAFDPRRRNGIGPRRTTSSKPIARRLRAYFHRVRYILLMAVARNPSGVRSDIQVQAGPSSMTFHVNDRVAALSASGQAA